MYKKGVSFMEKENEREEIRQTIRENLVMLRKVNNLTQDELAQRIGKKKAAVGAWEQGTSLPDIYTMSELAKLYGVTFEYLCGREENQAKRAQAYAQGLQKIKKNKPLDGQLDLFELAGIDKYGNQIETAKEAPKVEGEDVKVTREDFQDLLRATLDYARQLTEILERMENRDL
jgi:transcriptional regulator with XRE-family HTH domain